MDTFKNQELAINLKLFKQCRYYYFMFDSKLSTTMEWSGNQVSFMVVIAIFTGLLFYGSVGLFVELDVSYDFVEYCSILSMYTHAFLMLYKMTILMYNTNKFWEIFEVSQIKFLKSMQCVKNRNKLYTHRDKLIKITNIFCIFTIYLTVQWMIFPVVVEMFMPSNTDIKRKENVLNFPFPLTIQTYNTHFCIMYVIESFLVSFFIYGVFMIDFVLLSFGWVIITQYRVIIRAFADIGHGFDLEKYDYKEYQEQFKSVLNDLIRLDRIMKTFYSIVKPIVLPYVTIISLLIIMMTIWFVSIFQSLDIVSSISALKLGSSVFFWAFQLSLYCYLYDTLNFEKRSISFGMYSCNWTMMDLNFQEFLLLAMQTNDANHSILKFSPKKIINMQLFSNVLTTSCNIVSVMLKVMANKAQKPV